MEIKSDYWFEIMPKNKWHDCVHQNMMTFWYDAYKNENNDELSASENSFDDDEIDNNIFDGEIELSSDESEQYRSDHDDSLLEDQFLNQDGVDL